MEDFADRSRYARADHTSDPIFQVDGQWYFWDETWSNRSDPFPDQATARKALAAYAARL
jgi:hypothetical protein